MFGNILNGFLHLSFVIHTRIRAFFWSVLFLAFTELSLI